MKTSLKGRIAILSHEGIVETRYKDSKGIWTIGVGITAAAGAAINPNVFTGKISVEEAIALFGVTLAKYEQRVNRAIKVPLAQHEFDALVSFDYNTGAIHRAAATKLINAGNKQAGSNALMNYVKPPELRSRRLAEVTLFKVGDYGHGRVSVFPATKAGRVNYRKGRQVNAAKLLGVDYLGLPHLPPKPEPPEPLDLPDQTIEDILREEGSRTINHADDVAGSSLWSRFYAIVSGGGMSSIFYFLEGIPDWMKAVIVLSIICMAIIIWLEWRQSKAASAIREARVDDAKSGKNVSRISKVVREVGRKLV